MPSLPCPLPFFPSGGDLPVKSTEDVLAAYPEDVRRVQEAPVRDAIVAAQEAMFKEFQWHAAYAAIQSDPTRATGDYLDEFTSEVGIHRQEGEDTEALRDRYYASQQVVTPNAIKAAVDAILAQVTTVRCQLYESVLDRWYVNDQTANDPAPPDPAGLLAATTVSTDPVTVLAADLLAAGKAALLAFPRNVTFTTAGNTPSDAPDTADIVGTDIDDAPLSETVSLAQVAIIARGTKAFKTITTITFDAGDGTDATISIGFGRTFAPLPVTPPAAWHSFVGDGDVEVGPDYPDRYYEQRGHSSPGGAIAFQEHHGCHFILRLPNLSNSADQGTFMFGEGTPADYGDRAFFFDGTDPDFAAYVFGGAHSAAAIYAEIVNSVTVVAGQGVRVTIAVEDKLNA